MDSFERIPECYQEICDLVGSLYLPPQSTFDEFKRSISECARQTYIGDGRTGEIADAFKFFLRNLGYKEVFGPYSIPSVLKADDLVSCMSGSGTSNTPVEKAKLARKVGAKVYGWTSNPHSKLGMIPGIHLIKIEGKSKIDHQNNYHGRQILGGPFAPLAPLGTQFELRLLFTSISVVGNIVHGSGVRDVFNRLYLKCKEYNPVPEQFRDLYKIVPKPRSVDNPSAGKTIVIGQDFTGIIGKNFTTRFRHAAKEGEERDVSFYTDKGTVSVNRGDLVLFLTGSGRESFYELAVKLKDKGVKIGTFTSFPDTNLARISDATVIVPGRILENIEGLTGSYYPKEPEKSVFELMLALSLECYVYLTAQEEHITEQDMLNKHSDIT